MCVNNIIAEKQFKIGSSKLCWNFSTINKNGADNYRFCRNFPLRKMHFCPQEVGIMWPFCLLLERFN